MGEPAAEVAYHYAPLDSLKKIRQHGILSLRGQREAGLDADYRSNLCKYRDRATKGLGLDHPATDKEIEQWLSKLRGHDWDGYIYAFREPIPENAAAPFRDFAKRHRPFKVLVPQNSPDGFPVKYEYIPKVVHDFSKPPEGPILFENIPHIGIRVGARAKLAGSLLDPGDVALKAAGSPTPSVVYHGSPALHDVLRPRADHGDPSVSAAVFATPHLPMALAYTGAKWGDRDIDQTSRGGRDWTLREMRPNALQEIFGKGKGGYLYELPGESFKRPARSLGSDFEVISDAPVTPLSVRRVENPLEELEAAGVRLEKFDPESEGHAAAVRRMARRATMMDANSFSDYLRWVQESNPRLANEIRAAADGIERHRPFKVLVPQNIPHIGIRVGARAKLAGSLLDPGDPVTATVVAHPFHGDMMITHPPPHEEPSMSTVRARTPANDAKLQKFAAADQRDSQYAFELGFTKAAQDLGMNRDEFNRFYQIAVADHAAALNDPNSACRG